MKINDLFEEGAVGYIAKNKKEANDPRYSMSITQDVKPGEPARQAAKFGNKVPPPTFSKSAAKNSTPNKLMNLGLTEGSNDPSALLIKLITVAKESELGSPEHAQAMDVIDNLLNAVSVSEDLNVSDTKKIQALLAQFKDPASRLKLETLLQDPANVRIILKIEASAKKSGKEEQIGLDLKNAKELNHYVTVLTQKATHGLDALNNVYKHQSKAGEDVTSEKPKDVNQSALITQIQGAIQSSFKDIEFSSINKNALERKVLDFMKKAATDGIFTFNDLLKKGRGTSANIFDLVPDQYKEVMDLVGRRLLSSTVGTGAGSWGPGELGLCILGSPVAKAKKKGDLEIGGEPVELKASRDPKKGARLNTDALLNGYAARTEYHALLVELAKLVKKSPKDLLTYPITRKGKVVGKGKRNSLNNFGAQTIGQLNYHVFDKLKNPTVALDFITNVVKSVLQPEAHKFISKALLKNAVDVNGKVHYVPFIEAYIQILLKCYSEFDGVNTILIINPVTGNYTIVNDSKQLIDQMRKGIIQYSGGLDFGNKQSKASPQLGIA